MGETDKICRFVAVNCTKNAFGGRAEPGGGRQVPSDASALRLVH